MLGGNWEINASFNKDKETCLYVVESATIQRQQETSSCRLKELYYIVSCPKNKLKIE